MKKTIFLTILFVLALVSLSAQEQKRSQLPSPYKHSIGLIGGTARYASPEVGVSYKTFVSKRFGFQMDAVYGGWTYGHMVQLSLSGMYEGNIVKGFYWFAGGSVLSGLSMWWEDSNKKNIIAPPHCGIYALAGFEYAFNFPLTLQLDVRPGYMSIYGLESRHFVGQFDLRFDFSIRYHF